MIELEPHPWRGLLLRAGTTGAYSALALVALFGQQWGWAYLCLVLTVLFAWLTNKEMYSASTAAVWRAALALAAMRETTADAIAEAIIDLTDDDDVIIDLTDDGQAVDYIEPSVAEQIEAD